MTNSLKLFSAALLLTAATTLLAYAQPGGGGVIMGYHLATANLRSTPLTALARLLALVQTGNVNDTTLYATRFDLFQQAGSLGLAAPGAWVAMARARKGTRGCPGSSSQGCR